MLWKVIILILATSTVARAGLNRRFEFQYRYEAGEPVTISTDVMRSTRMSGVTYSLSSVCPSCVATIDDLAGNMTQHDINQFQLRHHLNRIGRWLMGVNIELVSRTFAFRKNEPCVPISKSMTLLGNNAVKLARLIANEYKLTFIVDNIVSIAHSKDWTASTVLPRHPEFGVRLGDVDPNDVSSLLYNMYYIRVAHSADGRIINVSVEPRSQHTCEAPDRVHVRTGVNVQFMIGIEWQQVTDAQAARLLSFREYIGAVDGSASMALVYMIPPIMALLGVVVVYYIQVATRVSTSELQNGIARRLQIAATAIQLDVIDAAVHTNSWKTIANFVYQKPWNPMLLSTIVGVGWQMIFAFTFAVVFAIGGYWNGYIAERFITLIFWVAVFSLAALGFAKSFILQMVRVHGYRPQPTVDVVPDTPRRAASPPLELEMLEDGVTEATPLTVGDSEVEDVHDVAPNRKARVELENERRVNRETIAERKKHALENIGGARTESQRWRAITDTINLLMLVEISEEEQSEQAATHVNYFTLCFSRVVTDGSLTVKSLLFVLLCVMIPTFFCFYMAIVGISRAAGGDTMTSHDVMAVSFIWFGLGTVFVTVGYIFGKGYTPRSGVRPYREYENNAMPTRSVRVRNDIRRVAIITCLCFATIQAPMLGFLRSFWGSRVDYAFMWIFVSMLLNTAIVCLLSATFVFRSLNMRDHRWWWKALNYGGSFSLAVLLVCWQYYVFYSDITSRAGKLVYLVYSFMMCIGSYAMMGAVSFAFVSHSVASWYRKTASD